MYQQKAFFFSYFLRFFFFFYWIPREIAMREKQYYDLIIVVDLARVVVLSIKFRPILAWTQGNLIFPCDQGIHHAPSHQLYFLFWSLLRSKEWAFRSVLRMTLDQDSERRTAHRHTVQSFLLIYISYIIYILIHKYTFTCLCWRGGDGRGVYMAGCPTGYLFP